MNCYPRILVVGAMFLAAGTASAQTLRDVSFGLASSSMTGGTARIAKELGLFEKHGLNAKIIVMDSGNAATTALVSKSVNFAVSGAGDLITPNAKGRNIVAIANAYNGLGGGLVLSKAAIDKLGISATAPVKDRLKVLDGLLIGTTSPTSVLTISLKGAALGAGANIRFTYLAQPAYTAALESGAIQGFIGGAPFWAHPIVRGSGVLWLNGAKGEFPPENAPTTSSLVMTLRETAEADPELVKKVKAVFVELGTAVEERPADVRAAIARLYPDLSSSTIDLLFDNESGAWKSPPLTIEQMEHEIAYVKLSGQAPPEIDRVSPASLIMR